MARILYVTYDGLTDPLGISQVLRYLQILSTDHDIHVLSFEKQDGIQAQLTQNQVAATLRKSGIRWTQLNYHRSPPVLSTLRDVRAGRSAIKNIVRSEKRTIIHARSYVPSLMALDSIKSGRCKLLFDMRGFWPEERVDGGLWRERGMLFRAAKHFERRFFQYSSHVVTLTEASIPHVQRLLSDTGSQSRVSVITTCVDLKKFLPRPRLPGDPFVLGYVGSFGTWYLLKETLQFFREIAAIAPDARMLIVNKGDHDIIRDSIAQLQIQPSSIELVSAHPDQVPHHIQRMTAATSLIKPCFSKTSSAPTKIGEYLACGVPCVSSAGIGDVEPILERHKSGVIVRDFGSAALARAAKSLFNLASDTETAGRCRYTAEQHFSIDIGAQEYSRIYTALGS